MPLNSVIRPQISILKHTLTRITKLTKNSAISRSDCGCKSMASRPNLKPPAHVAGQTVLDKRAFEKTITIPYLHVKGVKLSSIMPHVKKFLLKMENLKPVKTINSEEANIYLNPELATTWEDLSVEAQDALIGLGIDRNCVKNKTQVLKYENYSLDAILKAILPRDLEGLSSFTKVGHIVHLNLREHLLEYKNAIGQILFEKVPGCRSVVNKVGEIDNTYRNFRMEVLMGDADMRTQVKENKCIFEFDFSKVYWNSRLCTEHERIVDLVPKGAAVFDVFAGVGPFSLPVAKKKCHVYANDLNPESYKWLRHNINLNKIDEGFIKTYNKDGRDFILGEVRANLVAHLKEKHQVFIIMNLPALAVEFLDSFVNLYNQQDLPEMDCAPIVIVYCFAKGEDYVNIAKNLLFQSIGYDIEDKIIEIFRVRTVSSLKEMMRISFRLDRDILIGSVPTNKRKRIENDFGKNAKKCNHGEEQEENQ